MRKLMSYLLLPNVVSQFEHEYLARMTRVGMWFFLAHFPAMMIVAALAKTSIARAGTYTAVVLAGPMLAQRLFRNPRHVTRAYAFTAMTLGGLLVHFGQGPMQIEMHFYFFVLIALLAVFGDPLVVIVAALTVAAHHVLLWLAAPSSVFNYDASAWTVVVHASFVVLESVAACFVARSFFDNVIGLERIVRRRTEELAARTERMTLVLENVEQGLIIVQADGSLGAERSAILERLVGPIADAKHLWDWLRKADAEVGSWIQVGWPMLGEGFLPTEIVLAQLPRRFTRNGRVLQLTYRPLPSDGKFAGLLFVVTDMTSETERERYESDQHEMLALFERIRNDRSGVLEFATEANEIVSTTTDESTSLTIARRLIHTLKGNAGLFGCASLARACHDIETRIEETGCLTASDRSELRSSWAQVRGKLAMLVGDDERRTLEVDPRDHEEVVRTLREDRDTERAVEMLEDWPLEPTEIRLRRLADQAHSLATRLGKGEIDVQIEPNGVRLSPDRLRSFWASLLHVLRNAVDHGIEAPSERGISGKSSRGTINLATYLSGDELIVEVSDDGRGIPWERIRERAQARGLAVDSERALRDAIFADGISSLDVATEVSGRGVGMSALAAECRELGGTIDIASRAGRGTTVKISLPRNLLVARSTTKSRPRDHGLPVVG